MSYSRFDQLEVIKSLGLKDGDHQTMDCPFCGGAKKFTVDKFDGKTVWNCYRASCSAKGIYSGKRSIDTIRSRLSDKPQQRPVRRVIPVPSITTAPTNYIQAMKYLKSVNSLEAYENGLIKIRYAPAEDRVLFFNSSGTGAVGRALHKAKSKWWSYGDVSGGIHVGNGEHAVIVEDAASACSVSRLNGITGVALLGTNITKDIRNTLINYKRRTLVLDKDAANKSILMLRRVNLDFVVRLTKCDLKHLTVDDLREVINNA